MGMFVCFTSFPISKADMQPQWPQMTSILAQLSLSCYFSPFPPLLFHSSRRLTTTTSKPHFGGGKIQTDSVAPAHLVDLVITNCIDEIASIGIQC